MIELWLKYQLMFAILLFLIFIDQLSKYLIRYYDGFYICNSGVAFGIALPSWLPFLITILLIFFILLFLKSPITTQVFPMTTSNLSLKKKSQSSSHFLPSTAYLLLIIAGAISNLIDRLLHGCVIDFIDIKFFNYPLFNLADIFIVTGASLLIFKILFNKK